jgi:hypothetical protein
MQTFGKHEASTPAAGNSSLICFDLWWQNHFSAQDVHQKFGIFTGGETGNLTSTLVDFGSICGI